MSKTQDYYDILGVSRNASEDEIRSAYRKLARKYHPDVNKSPDASKRFSEITEAYDVLSDAEKRKQYDRFGRVDGAAGVGAGADAAGAGGGRWSYTTSGPGAGASGFGDFEDVFAEFFGGGASPFGGAGAGTAGRAHRAASPRPAKGPDVTAELPVTFLTAVKGGTESVRLSSGTGGQGQQIDVKVPPGIEHGAKLRLKGRGRPGQQGGAPGDLILTVSVGRHPYYRRDGLDLYIDVPISIAEAALGTNVTVPLLDGSADIRIPPGAASGRKLRMQGKGITDASGKTGDLYAVIQIKGPEKLSDRARSILEELSGELQNPRESAPWADDT